MVKPVESAFQTVAQPVLSAIAPVTKAIGRATTLPGPPQAPAVNIPAPPGVIPAQQPTARPARKSMQQSFLSSAAGAALQSSGGGGQGKTLLGQ